MWQRQYATQSSLGIKGERNIRQSSEIISAVTKRRLPKLECRKAICNAKNGDKTQGYAKSDDIEYLAWQRSLRSSLSKGKPCTWRRKAVCYFSKRERKVFDTL